MTLKKKAGDLQSPGQSGGFETHLAKSVASSIRFKAGDAIRSAHSRTDFAVPNIPDAAMQHHYTKVAICGFLRRNWHEPPLRAIKTCSLSRCTCRIDLKRKSSLNENRRPLACRSRTGAAPPRMRR